MVSHVGHTEHDVAVVVTEQGVADLRGKSPRKRAETIVECCAHPEFRPRLRGYLSSAARAGGHLRHDLDEAFSFRNNDS